MLEVMRKKILVPENSDLQRLCFQRTLHSLTCDKDCPSAEEIEDNIADTVLRNRKRKKKKKDKKKKVKSLNRLNFKPNS